MNNTDSHIEFGHEHVDLGLSVNWATCNIGAGSPEEYGDYYSWGELEPKAEYTHVNYKLLEPGSDRSYLNLTKYNYHDNIITLEPSDDVARDKWGGSWRLPTKAEFDELMANSHFEPVTINGSDGYKVTSMVAGYTDRSIFLPLAGYCMQMLENHILAGDGMVGRYWSSSVCTDKEVDHLSKSYGYDTDLRNAWCLHINPKDGRIKLYDEYRYMGFSVRSVFEK